jgi:hypothetical protein
MRKLQRNLRTGSLLIWRCSSLLGENPGTARDERYLKEKRCESRKREDRAAKGP